MKGTRSTAVFRLGALALGFGFLYLPIAVLIVYSFNASRLVTIWGGFSTRWYGALLENDKFRSAALTSLEVQRMVIEEATNSRVPPALALAVAKVESNFEARALSPEEVIASHQRCASDSQTSNLCQPPFTPRSAFSDPTTSRA